MRAPASVRITTIALTAALAATTTYWTLQLAAPRPAIAPAGPLSEPAAAIDLAPAARLFGGPAPAAQAAVTNLQVLGVAEAGRRGMVVIQVDGQPPRAYAVGDTLPDGSRVLEARAGGVALDRGGVRIDLSTPARGSVSVLTAGAGAAGSAAGSTSGPAPGTGGPPGAAPAPGRPPAPGAFGSPGQPGQPGGAGGAASPGLPPPPPAGMSAPGTMPVPATAPLPGTLPAPGAPGGPLDPELAARGGEVPLGVPGGGVRGTQP